MTWKRAFLALTAIVATLAIAGGAYALGAARGPDHPKIWTDDQANDVVIPQTALIDIGTKTDLGDNKQDYKYSLSAPIEVWPGYWCRVLASDVHTEYLGNFPYDQCRDESNMTPRQLTYIHDTKHFKLSIDYVDRNMGYESPPDAAKKK